MEENEDGKFTVISTLNRRLALSLSILHDDSFCAKGLVVPWSPVFGLTCAMRFVVSE